MPNILDPMGWPLFYRRAFLLLLPITLPVLLFVWLATLAVCVAVVFVAGIPLLIWEELIRPMWEPRATLSTTSKEDKI